MTPLQLTTNRRNIEIVETMIEAEVGATVVDGSHLSSLLQVIMPSSEDMIKS